MIAILKNTSELKKEGKRMEGAKVAKIGVLTYRIGSKKRESAPGRKGLHWAVGGWPTWIQTESKKGGGREQGRLEKRGKTIRLKKLIFKKHAEL